MAATQSALFIPPHLHPGDPYRRPPPPIQLPPLRVPNAAHISSPARENSFSLSNYSYRPAPNVATEQSPLAAFSRTRGLGPAAPLANLLSPVTNTPRPVSTYSNVYETRTSPHPSGDLRLVAEARPRRFVGEQHSAVDFEPVRERAHASEAATRLLRARIPSPTYAPTHGHSHLLEQATYRSAQHAVEEASASTSVASGIPYAVSHHNPATPEASGTVARKAPLQCELRIRQQPVAARACGFGERDRRVVDPPPILQLHVRDPQSGSADLDELRYSLHIIHCTLWNAEGTAEETALRQPDRHPTRRLMGQLVASPSIAKDERDEEGCFFCFPDLSCRTHGRYRLRFILIRMDPANMHVGSFSPILTEVLSDVFTVYSAKDFPGMQPSSALTRALKLQGCNIQVKKGNERSHARKRKSFSDHDEGEGSIDSRSRLKRLRDSP